jgi:hypothetical protein
MRLQRIAMPFAVALVVAAGGAFAQPRAVDAVTAGEVVTLTAKIEAVDPVARTVVIKGPMGRTIALRASDQVKNFAQVKVGDEVVVKYAEAVSVALTKGAAGRSETVASAGPVTNPAGAKPGVAVGQTTTIVASVERVDAARNMVLFEGPNGRYAEVKVRDAQVMKDLKVGDKVEVTLVEAALIEVVAPKQ